MHGASVRVSCNYHGSPPIGQGSVIRVDGFGELGAPCSAVVKPGEEALFFVYVGRGSYGIADPCFGTFPGTTENVKAVWAVVYGRGREKDVTGPGCMMMTREQAGRVGSPTNATIPDSSAASLSRMSWMILLAVIALFE